MKTKSFFAIAIELFVTVSLIALLGLILALVYALLSFLSPATQAAAPQMSETITQPLTATKPELAPTIYALPEAKESPKLEAEPITEIVTPSEFEPEITDYAKMTTRALRPLARDRKIPKWNKLNKKELIAALSA